MLNPIRLKISSIREPWGGIVSTDILGVDRRMVYLPPAYDYGHDEKDGTCLLNRFLRSYHLVDPGSN
jgi:hypothetical protein